MAYFGKEFQYERHEKFEEFLASFGLPKDRLEKVLAFKTSQKLEKDGDTYTLTFGGHDGVKTLSFKPGVEFDEKVGSSVVIVAKTTFIVDGDTIVQTQKYPDGRIVIFKKEFSENKIVETATNSFWDGGVAYRYYSA